VDHVARRRKIRIVYKILVGKPENLGNRCRSDNNKINGKEIGCGDFK
jgi:hypothetical protein